MPSAWATAVGAYLARLPGQGDAICRLVHDNALQFALVNALWGAGPPPYVILDAAEDDGTWRERCAPVLQAYHDHFAARHPDRGFPFVVPVHWRDQHQTAGHLTLLVFDRERRRQVFVDPNLGSTTPANSWAETRTHRFFWEPALVSGYTPHVAVPTQSVQPLLDRAADETHVGCCAVVALPGATPVPAPWPRRRSSCV